mgnify:FL=1
MIKRICTLVLTGTIHVLNAIAYALGLTAAGFGVVADSLDRLRTLYNMPDDDDDPYDDIHNADDPNITKNYTSE